MIYGKQFRGTRQDYRMGRDQIEALNQKLRFLPERIAQQKAEQQHQDTLKLGYDQLAQARSQHADTMGMEKKRQKTMLGMEIGKTALQTSLNPIGRKTLKGAWKGATDALGMKSPITGRGGFAANVGGVHKMAGPAPSTFMGKVGEGLGSVFNNMNLSNTLGAAGMGYGISQLMGDQPKWKKAALGAGAAGALNLFTGGEGGSDLVSAGIGSIFGGLGSLF